MKRLVVIALLLSVSAITQAMSCERQEEGLDFSKYFIDKLISFNDRHIGGTLTRIVVLNVGLSKEIHKDTLYQFFKGNVSRALEEAERVVQKGSEVAREEIKNSAAMLLILNSAPCRSDIAESLSEVQEYLKKFVK